MVVGYVQYIPFRFCGNGNIPLEFAAVGDPHPSLPELEEEAVLVVLESDPLVDPEPVDCPVLADVLELEPPVPPWEPDDSDMSLDPVEPVPSDELVEDPAQP